MTTLSWLWGTVAVLAQESPPPASDGSTSPHPLDLLVQYGLPGIVLVLIILGKLWPQHAVSQKQAHYEAQLVHEREQHAAELARMADEVRLARQQRDEMIAAYEQRVVPVMTQFIGTVDRFSAMMSRAGPPPSLPPRRADRGWPDDG